MNSLRSHRPARGWKRFLFGSHDLLSSELYDHIAPQGDGNKKVSNYEYQNTQLYDRIAPQGDGNSAFAPESEPDFTLYDRIAPQGDRNSDRISFPFKKVLDFTIASPRKGMETQISQFARQLRHRLLRSQRPARGWKLQSLQVAHCLLVAFTIAFPRKGMKKLMSIQAKEFDKIIEGTTMLCPYEEFNNLNGYCLIYQLCDNRFTSSPPNI